MNIQNLRLLLSAMETKRVGHADLASKEFENLVELGLLTLDKSSALEESSKHPEHIYSSKPIKFTGRGLRFIQMLIDTPLPTQQTLFVDPRRNSYIDLAESLGVSV